MRIGAHHNEDIVTLQEGHYRVTKIQKGRGFPPIRNEERKK